MNIKTIIFAVCLQVCGLTILAQNVLVISDVTVIPSHLNDVWLNRDVVFRDGMIIQIQEHAAAEYPADAAIVDGSGKYLVPAFVDAHGHLPDSTVLDHYSLLQLYNGITRVRSMRGQEWHYQLKDQEALPWYYPDFDISPPPISWRDSMTAEELTTKANNWKTKGFDFIKLLSVANENTYDTLAAIASQLQLPIAGHFPSNVELEKFISSVKILSIEHLSALLRIRDGDAIYGAVELFRKQGIAHCPTLSWYYTNQRRPEELITKPGLKYVSTDRKTAWKEKMEEAFSALTAEEQVAEIEKEERRFQVRLNYLHLLYQQGGLLLLSPDASGTYGIPGFDYLEEVIHYQNAGLPAHEILKATAYNYAVMLGEEGSWGTIKVGVKSDVLLLEDDPLTNIQNLTSISGIVKDGVFHKREEVQKLLEQTTNAY